MRFAFFRTWQVPQGCRDRIDALRVSNELWATYILARHIDGELGLRRISTLAGRLGVWFTLKSTLARLMLAPALQLDNAR